MGNFYCIAHCFFSWVKLYKVQASYIVPVYFRSLLFFKSACQNANTTVPKLWFPDYFWPLDHSQGTAASLQNSIAL